MRESSAAKKYKDIPSLAKAYGELEAMQGNSLRFPSKDAGDADRVAFRAKVLERGKDYGVIAMPGADKPEEQAAVFRALGAPEKPEGYVVPQIQDADGLKFDATEAEALRPVFHKAGITQRQFDVLVNGVAEARRASALEQVKRTQESAAKLKATWGEATEAKTGQVVKWLELNKAPDSLRMAVKGGQVGADSMLWLHGLMTTIGGEASEISGQEGGRVTVTPAESLARVGEIERRMKDMNPSDPEYQILVQDRLKWLERANLE